VTVLTGPRAHAAFFRAPDDQLSAKEAYQFTVPIFGPGIAYDASPEIMGEQLGLVFPALRDERLQAYAVFMEEEVRRYLANWGKEGEVDLLDAANDLTVFIASRCLVGKEFREGLSTEFARLYADLEEGINLLAFFQPRLPLPSFRRRDRARVRMVELISQIIAKRRTQGSGGEDFLETLMTARYGDGSSLFDEAITGLLLTLIFAGQHTSAVLAAWTGILLLSHPEHLAPILEEQERIWSAGPATLEKLRQLSVLERAIKEAERMRPPLVMLMRKIRRDFEYGGCVARAGGLALVSPAVAHRLPEVFADPDRYDPSRFAPPREEDRRAPFSLIGFGGGKHRCIGLTFAYQQIKVIWSVLLREFELEFADPEPPPDYSTFVVGPRQPCRVRYRRISQRSTAYARATG
jgi:sterol 14-demethylase